MINRCPWSFDNIMLVLQIIPPGENHVDVPLFFLNFRIQIHDLPSDFMTKVVGKQFGAFFSEFIMYD